ncbi:hypothetical protein G6F22_016627 [Rhizopus arrhizus]|nr:hypothetical protein G6F22_016627 [Rhizopus arrhizus]
MLDQVLALFELRAQHDLDIMVPNQTLNGLYARLISRVDGVLEAEQPDCVLVHGDTSTASACALASFHRRVRIGHVEAGLRTGNLAMPFPEEMNRRVVDAVGDWLFAPTSESRGNLLRENLAGHITVTGNTVIDALAMTCAKLDPQGPLARQLEARYDWLDPSRRLLLVTGHRHRLSRAPEPAGTQCGDDGTGRPVARALDRSPGLPGLRLVHATVAPDPDRFRWGSGRGPLPGQAGTGDAGRDRAS